MKNELFLLDGFKVFGDVLRFTGEDENGKLYNVEFSEEDISAYFGVEYLDIAKEEEETIRDAAQGILDAWSMRGTGYEVTVVAQKLKAYRFDCLSGEKHTLCYKVVGDVTKFMKNNINYTNYTSIWG